MKRIALTGGIACGKSLLSDYLRDLGIALIDADEVVHELIPLAERKRLAAVVFNNPEQRRNLEARIHPIVKARLEEFFTAKDTPGVDSDFRIAAIPLLFEVHWDAEYDIICCIRSSRESQIRRMIETRGYSRAEAEARLAAQLPIEEKAKKSHYVINNDGSREELRQEAEKFVSWLKNSMCSPMR